MSQGHVWRIMWGWLSSVVFRVVYWQGNALTNILNHYGYDVICHVFYPSFVYVCSTTKHYKWIINLNLEAVGFTGIFPFLFPSPILLESKPCSTFCILKQPTCSLQLCVLMNGNVEDNRRKDANTRTACFRCRGFR